MGTMGFGFRFRWAKYLTHLQIIQMVVGIATTATWSYQHYVQGFPCRGKHPDLFIISAFIMYGSYLILFVKFFFNKYGSAKRSGASASNAVRQAACDGRDVCGVVDSSDEALIAAA